MAIRTKTSVVTGGHVGYKHSGHNDYMHKDFSCHWWSRWIYTYNYVVIGGHDVYIMHTDFRCHWWSRWLYGLLLSLVGSRCLNSNFSVLVVVVMNGDDKHRLL